MQIDLSGHSFVFPNQCACCNGPADAELTLSSSKSSGKKVVHTKTNIWDVPYCRRCLVHVAEAADARNVVTLIKVIAVVTGLLFWYFVSLAVGIGAGFMVIFLGGVLFYFQMKIAKSKCSRDCACVDRAIVYLGWQRTLHQFEVTSTQYALALMIANQRKLVNLSREARSLLESHCHTSNALRSARRYEN